MAVDLPVDPLEAPRTSENLRREIRGLFDSYNAPDLDFVVENLQNAVDAVEEKHSSSTQSTPEIHLEFDGDRNIFRIMDNGRGLSDEIIKRLGSPSNSDKDPTRKRGHKGVGLVFAVWGTLKFRFATKRPGEEEITSGKIDGAVEWVEETIDDVPRVEEDEEFRPDFLEDQPSGTVFEFHLPAGNNVNPLLTRLNEQGLKTLLRQRTAAGYTDLPGTEGDEVPDWLDEAEITIKVDDRDSVEVEGRFLYPHDYFERVFDVDEVNGLDADEIRRLEGRHKCLYKRLDNDDVRALFSGEDIDEHLLEIVENQHISAYGAFLDEASTFGDWNEDLYVEHPGPGRKRQIVKPGINFATATMPCGRIQRIELSWRGGNANRTFIQVDMRDEPPDNGRKTYRPEVNEIAQRISKHLIEDYFVPNRSLTMARGSSGGETESEEELSLEETIQRALDRDGLPIEAKSIVKVPGREQEVVALFHSLVATGRLKGYEILAAHGSSERYDGVFRYNLDQDEDLIYETDPLGFVEESFGSNERIEFSESIVEFKHPLHFLLKDLQDRGKKFDDIKLAVAWEKGSEEVWDDASPYSLEPVGEPPRVEKQFHGETHLLWSVGYDDPVHVILLEAALEMMD